MNGATNLEHRASSSQDRHEGEPSLGLCDRLDRTRDNSQRQLPTDHDYAVPTREYQTDQSSLITAPAAARSVFGKQQKQRQKQTHPSRRLTRSLHIRPTRSLRREKAILFLGSEWIVGNTEVTSPLFPDCRSDESSANRFPHATVASNLSGKRFIGMMDIIGITQKTAHVANPDLKALIGPPP
jgi:hypothetical protein